MAREATLAPAAEQQTVKPTSIEERIRDAEADLFAACGADVRVSAPQRRRGVLAANGDSAR